jgi:uncharacterized protein YlxP (DUF503 family)
VVVGICRVELCIPDNDSLKGKRQVLRSIKDKVRNKFNVSIAEVDGQDLWQQAILGISCVSTSVSHANEVLSKVINLIDQNYDSFIVDYEMDIR